MIGAFEAASLSFVALLKSNECTQNPMSKDSRPQGSACGVLPRQADERAGAIRQISCHGSSRAHLTEPTSVASVINSQYDSLSHCRQADIERILKKCIVRPKQNTLRLIGAISRTSRRKKSSPCCVLNSTTSSCCWAELRRNAKRIVMRTASGASAK